MKKILSLILVVVLLAAGCAFAESYSYPEPVLFDTDMADSMDFQLEEWKESSKSRAALTTLIMADLILAGASEEFDFATALVERESYVAHATCDENSGADFDDSLIVIFRGEDRDLAVLYTPDFWGNMYVIIEPSAIHIEPDNIEKIIAAAARYREQSVVEYYPNELDYILEAMDALGVS